MDNAGPRTRALARLPMSSRAVLWVGFGSLLGLMVLVAVTASRALARIEFTNSQIRRNFLQRDDLLDRLRSDLYRSGIDLRDYLLHADPQLAERRRSEILLAQQATDQALSQYRVGSSSEETAALDQLQRDLDQYFALLQPVLSWDAEKRRLKGADFLRQEIFPRRQEMLLAAERIRQINTRQLDLGQITVATVFTDFRRELLLTTCVTILLGLGLAIFSMHRVQALERESRCRYQEVVGAREELHRLSRTLVAAQEAERRKLSRELHDEVGQAMSALLVELGNLAATVPPESRAAQDQLERVKHLAEANVVLVRNLSLLLRPSMLDDLGLVPALKWQAREMARRTNIKVKVDAEDVPDDLPDDYRTCIYRIVQEALENVTRHSQATHVRVTVRNEDAQVRVFIQDDGVGFVPREKGMGILGMEERVRTLGGQLHLESQPGHGTGISISLPIPCPETAKTL